MNIKIVTGIAGSGKSTYCKKLEAEGYRYMKLDEKNLFILINNINEY